VSKADLQKWLLRNPGFHRRFERLVVDSVAAQFPRLRRMQHGHTSHDWDYLLLCASVLAQSEDPECQDTSLRIAQFCLEQPHLNPTHKDAAAVILDSLANRLAIDLAERRRFLQEGFEGRLPFTLVQDWTRRSLENSVFLDNTDVIPVNHFQRAFWEKARDNDWISLSAPTSAGKSYILNRWIANYLRSSPVATVVYLVPTRALIQQVQRDIEAILDREGVQGVSVTTLPMRSFIESGSANVLVFTQERFHILASESGSKVAIDLLIIDEAQKVGDGQRGVLLQQAIEMAVDQNPKARVIFASPMTQNPELLLEDAPAQVPQAHITSGDTMVNQNLLWVSQVKGRPTRWDVELVLDKQPRALGRIELTARPTSDSKRLPFVAFALGGASGANVVYVNGAADAEKTAKQLYDRLGEGHDLSSDKDVQDLVELIRKTVHRDYALAHVLQRGVGFHYGNMPLLIRTEVERLFRANKIGYLVCTSTLVEGVNMPCRNIFARGPTKGRGRPMSPSDFWNLAGRAGRWGKEFQGNVVCVDALREGVWREGPPRSKADFPIARTSDRVLETEAETLLTFIGNDTPRVEAGRRPDLEYVFSYLVSYHVRHGSLKGATWTRRVQPSTVEQVSEAIGQVVERLRTPPEVVLRNPGISPIAMDALLTYFADRTENRHEPVEDLLPVLPESDDAVDQYLPILSRVDKHLGGEFGQGGRAFPLALLIVDWMRGRPLALIIAKRIDYYEKKGQKYHVPGVIRDIMRAVEEVARFRAPKYLACYVDLLKAHLERIDRRDLIESLSELKLNVLLEFGVSQHTQLSLISLGLSRSSAIALSELIADTELDEQGCLKWLAENDWMTADMPELIRREIGDLLKERTA